MTSDPISYRGKDVNLFRYVKNNPLSFSDTYGLAWDQNSYIACFCAVPCAGAPNIQNLAAMAQQALETGNRIANDPKYGLKINSPKHRAFRHCVASGYLAKLTGGCGCGLCIGNTREDYQTRYEKQSGIDKDVAIKNNTWGAICAGCKPRRQHSNEGGLVPSGTRMKDLDDIVACCKDKLDKNQLDIRTNPDGTPSPEELY